MCVLLMTLEAALIYSAKNGQQMETSNPANWLLRFRNSRLNSLHCSFQRYSENSASKRHRNTAAKTAITGMSAGDWSSHQGYVR